MDLSAIEKLLSQLSNPNRLFGGVYGAGGSGPSILRDPLGGGQGQSSLSGSLGTPQGSNSNGFLQQLLNTINPEGQKSGQAPSKF